MVCFRVGGGRYTRFSCVPFPRACADGDVAATGADEKTANRCIASAGRELPTELAGRDVSKHEL